MNLALVAVEVALSQDAVKEYRMAMENVYAERDRARARFKARGERDPGPVFTTPGCQRRVRSVEAQGLDLLARARRNSKEKLTWVIGLAALGPGDGTAASQVHPGAARYWDTMEVSKEFSRSSRPWDMSAPVLDTLLQILEDARICGADSKLRRKAEGLLFMAVERCLEAALATEVDRGYAVHESLKIADEAIAVSELQDPGDSLKHLCTLAEKEVVRTSLRNVESTCKEFHQAVKDGDIELVKWMLDREKANPSITDPDTGIPPLVMAAKVGDVAMCELLLDRGSDIDARCSADGTSSLHWACHSRMFRIVKLLLERRANPRLQDKRGHDPLVKLVRRDFVSPAEACAFAWHRQDSQCLAGPQLETSGFMSIDAAKVAAESEGCVGFSVYKIDSGAEYSDQCFHITLHGPGCATAVVGSSRTEEASDLVWSHADPERTSFLKVKNDVVHDVSILLASGADPCAEDLKGLTALHHHLLSAPGGGCLACISALLRGGADVNHCDAGARQTTPFIMVIQNKRTDLVDLMLKTAWPPPDVDSKAPDGTCALALATNLGAHQIADKLRKAGASDWADAELRLGCRTTFSYDTRKPPVNS